MNVDVSMQMQTEFECLYLATHAGAWLTKQSISDCNHSVTALFLQSLYTDQETISKKKF